MRQNNALPRTPVDSGADQDFRALLRRIDALEVAAMADYGTVSGAVALNFRDAPVIKFTLGGNVTLTVTGYDEGKSFFLVIVQGASAYTITWPSNVKFADGNDFVPSTTASAVDIVSLLSLDIGTPYLYAVGQKNFS